MYDVFHAHIDVYRYSTIDLNCIFFHQIYNLLSHDICFVNVFGSSIPVLMLKMRRSFVLSRIQTL